MNRSSMKSCFFLLLWFLFAALFLLFPKFALFHYYSGPLWGNYGLADLLCVSAQDVLIASLFFGCVCWAMTRDKMGRLMVLAAVLFMSLFVLLMLDTRARQLWLRPTDPALLRYLIAGLSDLQSGNDLFFKTDAGFGMTFRRLFAASCLVSFASMGLIMTLGLFHFRAGANQIAIKRLSSKFALRLVVPCCALSFVVSVLVPRYDYALQQNFLVGALVDAVRSAAGLEKPPDLRIGEHFEQKAVSASESLDSAPRNLLKDAAPFSNLIIVAFESLRWKNMGFDTREFNYTPFLSELAGSGLLAKYRPTLPHSCKCEFSMITGRHPYPGIEIREALAPRHESLFWVLREHGVANTYCFSGLFLAFENLAGILQSCGIEDMVQTYDLLKNEPQPKVESSFGGGDDLLIKASAQMIKRPFAAFFLPFAAHYPYLYPGKPADQGADFSAYVQSVRYSDAILRQLFQELGANGLLENTLVVILGDHGESFGEHGSSAHNNSMYEEEITAPLILWSSDNRLKESATLACSGVDITPTILDLFGIHDSRLPVQGGSMLRKSGTQTIYVSSFFQDVSKAIIMDNLKYMYLPSSKKLLRFDLALDPDEKGPANLSTQQTPETLDILARFQAFDAYQRSQFPAASR